MTRYWLNLLIHQRSIQNKVSMDKDKVLMEEKK